MTVPFGELFGISWLFPWQIPLVILLILLIVFWNIYRRKQM
ncbi:MAG: hypothetical protein SVT52_04900 [Planctomycetota bacterium]|nr:hypothetical protein [Planctomycetota bacterium]